MSDEPFNFFLNTAPMKDFILIALQKSFIFSEKRYGMGNGTVSSQHFSSIYLLPDKKWKALRTQSYCEFGPLWRYQLMPTLLLVL